MILKKRIKKAFLRVLTRERVSISLSVLMREFVRVLIWEIKKAKTELTVLAFFIL
jgi:hypothetical protein